MDGFRSAAEQMAPLKNSPSPGRPSTRWSRHLRIARRRDGQARWFPLDVGARAACPLYAKSKSHQSSSGMEARCRRWLMAAQALHAVRQFAGG
jgi:hypothetical protein